MYKKNLLMALLIFGVIFISGCSLVNNKINNQYNKKIQVENEAAVIKNDDQNVISKGNNEIEDRNRYRNDELGFELIGPEEFIVEVNNEISFVTPQNRKISLENINNCSDNNSGTVCNPTFNETSFTVKILNDKNDDPSISELKNITVNGIHWEQYIVPSPYSDIYFETEYNDKYYLIHSFYSEEKTINILESFNFFN
jgi:hypothetical protein